MAIQGRGQGVSLTQLIRGIERDLVEVRTLFLKNVASEIVDESPVDTGTYVMGHNVSAKSSAGQFTGQSVYIGPRGADKASMQNAARTKMFSEIDALPDNQTVVNISNAVGHAQIVEYKHKPVYSIARNNASQHLQKAIQTVRATR